MHLFAGAGHAGDRLPGRPVTLEVGDQGGVDVVVLQGPDEDGGDQPAVLAHLVDLPSSAARASRMSLVTPDISAASRGRPNMNSSISVSQVRKRGQARVHDVQPFLPWPQSVGPSSSSRWKGLYTPVGVPVAEDVVRAGDHAPGAPRTQAAE